MITLQNTNRPRLKVLKLEEVRRHPDLQPRVELNDEIVAEYRDAIQAGTRMPPVTVFFDGTYYNLVDGYHRHKAHGSAKVGEIGAEVYSGSFRDAQLHAMGANANHGLRRTHEDKRRAVKMLLADSEWSTWSDREIARRCHVSHPLVAEVRRDMLEASLEELPVTASRDQTSFSRDAEKSVRYTTKHGTQAVMQTGKIGRAEKRATLHAFDVESDSTGAVPTEDRVSNTSNKESFEQCSKHAPSIPSGMQSGLPNQQPQLPKQQLPNRQPLTAGDQPVTQRDAAVTTDDENDPRTVAGFHKLYNHAAWSGRNLAWYQEQFRELMELTGAEDEAEVVSIVRTLCVHAGTL